MGRDTTAGSAVKQNAKVLGGSMALAHHLPSGFDDSPIIVMQ